MEDEACPSVPAPNAGWQHTGQHVLPLLVTTQHRDVAMAHVLLILLIAQMSNNAAEVLSS